MSMSGNRNRRGREANAREARKELTAGSRAAGLGRAKSESSYQMGRWLGLRGLRVLGGVVCLTACGWAQNAPAASAEDVRQLREMVRQLAERDTKLEAEVAELRAELHPMPAVMTSTNEARGAGGPIAPKEVALERSTPVFEGAAITPTLPSGTAPAAAPNALTETDRGILDYLKGNTVNFLFDGYYGYNFNAPIGRVNLLRAYDVLSNTFSINQADVVFEHPTDVAAGHRFGMRMDLQFGQATATLQGNPANEPRPDIYRNIFQVYGTYVVPVGRGLTVDFGKWGSSLGIEGNYTKDQINYSRSLWFSALPFYHMGVRANFPVTSKLAVNYWVVNGTQQTEPTNGFKDQMFGLVVTPHKNVTWTINYYLGQEHPDVLQVPNNTPIPTQPGLNFVAIRPAPNGKLDIFDSYVTWQTTPKLTLAWEADYEIQRLWANAAAGHSSAPSEISGTAGYAQYQLSPHWAVGARAEYLSDPQGMFSGVSQALKETTATLDYKVADGFLMRYEWRRDFSNQAYFLTSTQGVKSEQQNTATVGLIWWFGRKQGAW
jgi:Putative beta-barrel porin-2, OmpL-like. bbp2